MSNISPSYKEFGNVIIEEIRARDRLIEQLGEALEEVIGWTQGVRQFLSEDDDTAQSARFSRLSDDIVVAQSALAAYREWKEEQDGHQG